MREVKLRGKTLSFDDFMLCVPLTGKTLEEISAEVKGSISEEPHAFEWRMDYFHGDLLTALPAVRSLVQDKILIYTLRSEAEGGLSRLADGEYLALLTEVINSGCDIIDIELSRGEEIASKLNALAHEKGTASIISYHNFDGMLGVDEIADKMRKMRELGADIPKIAMMAKTREEAESLFAVPERIRECAPYILIAMGEAGRFTRVSRDLHSCCVFASGRNASAPGQMSIREAKEALYGFEGEENG